MTDPATADVTYIEPITWQTVEKIIAKERPDAILPTMGGQTALNCALDLWRNGVLDKVQGRADRCHTRSHRQGRRPPEVQGRHDQDRSGLCTFGHCAQHGRSLGGAEERGFPTVIRPSFTLGGTGGGIAYNPEEFETICKRGLEASPTNELLIEESLLGWKNTRWKWWSRQGGQLHHHLLHREPRPDGRAHGRLDHRGPSADADRQGIPDHAQRLFGGAAREIGVDTGGSNVQFSVNPKDGRMIVIEMNPRVSRSSALASKATGFPIAKVAAKLAVGYTLDELKNEITGGATPASFEPSIDYVVTKIPFCVRKIPRPTAA